MSGSDNAKIGTLMKMTTSFDFNDDEVVIDVRSPSEYEEDHVSGAINLPVLSDEEFRQVGTIYNEKSPFEASKVGSALVAKNIARHLEEFFGDKDRGIKLVFCCARGGKRSSSFATVCRMVGWEASVVEGGYKAYRKHVTSGIAELCAASKFIVLAGKTGVGKTVVLSKLHSIGHNVIDLELLARHRGSILGGYSDIRQPKQKLFETRVFEKLSSFNDKNHIFVEAESNKIGNLFIPVGLWNGMKSAPTVVLENTLENRTEHVLSEYDPAFLKERAIPDLLSIIERNNPKIDIGRLRRNVREERWGDFVSTVIKYYYDPLYSHAISRRKNNFIGKISVDGPVKQSVSSISLEISSILSRGFAKL